jgi:hypothetical protein
VTDHSGTITIVETVTNLNGTTINVSLQGALGVTINPMTSPFKKLVALDSKEALKSASVPTGTKAGGIIGPTPPTKPLVLPDTSDDDLKAVAKSMTSLKKAYDGLDTPAGMKAKTSRLVRKRTFLRSHPDSIETAAGELYGWLKSVFENVIEIIYDAASGAWAFVTSIAGQVYHAILDTVDAVVGAVEWIYNKIKTAIEDLIALLELLLNWNNISNTKKVISDLVSKGFDYVIAELRKGEPAIDDAIASLVKDVNEWAGIQEWGPLAPLANAPADSAPSAPSHSPGSASQMLSGHFQDNSGGITVLSGGPPMTGIRELMEKLLSAVEHEGELLVDFAEELGKLAAQIGSLSVVDMLKKLIALVADVVLNSVQIVVDVMLEILVQVADSLKEVLNVKLHFPVISDILNALNIPDLTFLDVVSWIAAGVYTLGYEIAHGCAPFSSAEVDMITAEKDLAGIIARLEAPSPQSVMSIDKAQSEAHIVRRNSDNVRAALFECCHGIASVLLGFNTLLQFADAMEDEGGNAFSKLSTAASLPAAILNAVGNMIGGSQTIDPVTKLVSNQTLINVIAAKAFFATDAATDVTNDPRGLGAKVNLFFLPLNVYCTCKQIMEATDDSDQSDEEKRLQTVYFLNGAYDIQSYIARGIYTVMVNMELNPAKEYLGIGLTAVNVVGVALQLAEATSY